MTAIGPWRRFAGWLGVLALAGRLVAAVVCGSPMAAGGIAIAGGMFAEHVICGADAAQPPAPADREGPPAGTPGDCAHCLLVAVTVLLTGLMVASLLVLPVGAGSRLADYALSLPSRRLERANRSRAPPLAA